MNYNLPKVSIITPTYNSEKTIARCLQNVADQSYQNKEHLIIDARSKDSTLDIIRSYQQKYNHIKFISEPDKGVYDAMNKGIDLATGDWLLFMGSDDELVDSATLSSVFETVPSENYDILYGNIQHKNAGTRFSDEFTTRLLARFNIAHQAIFYRKQVFDITGKFDLKYFSGSDYAVNIQWFGDDTIRKKYIGTTICIYNEAGLSSMYFDKVFNREKPELLLKYLKFEKPEYFTDAARHTIYEQLRHRDITGALSNLLILFKHAGPSFDKFLFVKEFIVLLFNKNKPLKSTFSGSHASSK